MNTDTNQIKLGGYAAKQCPRRIHNDFDPTIEKVPWVPSPEVQARLDAGVAFEADVFAAIKTALGPSRVADLTAISNKAQAVNTTIEAMDAQIDVILGGWMTGHPASGRTGKPDLLIRIDEDRYIPGDVKAHQSITKNSRKTLTYSTLADPATPRQLPGYTPIATPRLDDYLQLAHYTDLLSDIDYIANRSLGVIIGTSAVPELDGELFMTWLDLEAPLFQTYSRSHGTTKRDAIERYKHEFDFRLEVAKNAAAGLPALVEPIFTAECDACPWLEYCRSITDLNTASAHITTGRLSIREWKALAKLGVTTLDDLAALDSTDPDFQARYLPEIPNVGNPQVRIGEAVRRAGMLQAGRMLELNTSRPVAIPRADLEIDLDAEWDPSGRVYLWGALVNTPNTAPVYRAFVTWDPLDEHSERALATELTTWLGSQIDAAFAQGHTVSIYHYSHPEPSHLSRILGTDAADVIEQLVDLLPYMRTNYFAANGLSLKHVAPEFGHTWRDADPGGAQSQTWLATARTTTDPDHQAARTRLLDYNEDDTRATKAIREGALQ